MPVGDVRVELPIDYRANVGYDVDRWAAVAEFGRGLQGKSFHGGGEIRLGTIDVRGGAVYSRELWNPAGGVGLNMSDRASRSTWRCMAIPPTSSGSGIPRSRCRCVSIVSGERFERSERAERSERSSELSGPSTNCAVSAS